MTLIFDSLVLEKILPSIKDAKIISSNKTRLGGSITHLSMASQKNAYLKVGYSYERLEIIR